MNEFSKEQLELAKSRVTPHIHRTPIMSSRAINKMVGAELFFKCENFQKGGAYKIRGALNATLSLSEDDRQNGLATHSSGNFAQAVALSANMTSTEAYIVMPEAAPKVKVEAVREYGAQISMSGNRLIDREELLEKVVQNTGAARLHPSNDVPVIIGQGTCALELLEDVALDSIITPVGGGGVIGGTCLACKYNSPTTKVYGAEPAGAADAHASLQKGEIVPSINPETIADGLRTQLGSNNFPIIKEHVSEIILVDDSEIIAAMRLIWERMKIIVEPSSAITLASIMKRKDQFKNQKIGLIITGGNVDLSRLPFNQM